MHVECPGIETDFRVEELMFSRLNLRSIFANLLTNAMKYRSPERECRVKISSWAEKDKVVLEVADNGIGMPKGYQNKVFKMFTRMHTHVDGSGVGLYIIKRIVDNANGQIEVESAEGRGTTFRVHLPVCS
ncbi:sensor histidine kinase [Cesiribacter andamanensis]|uniref:histidine kinase n=1 Tax=Cesiribacter andamanensis AMV16 TaxID=1279009 RepID=M7NNK6_9BACT|nr:ATP-binding protein [Cesiribacter andamanensis]EMR03285.1 Phytochrome-like protein cph1 [Cesiribacter andamanensis AMV16]